MCGSSARRVAEGVPVVRALLAVLVLVAVGGCSSGSPDASPEASPTPLARLDTAAAQLPRIEFCSLVPEPAVAAALGGPAEDTTSWGNGDEVDLQDPGGSGGPAGSGDPAGSDVVQELGCAWDRGEVSARAWLFARPVEPALARSVVRQAGAEPGCETPEGPGFGDPSVLQVCETDDGSRVRYAGLFDQTWLTCEVAGPDVSDERVEQWCVTLVNSLDTAS